MCAVEASGAAGGGASSIKRFGEEFCDSLKKKPIDESVYYVFAVLEGGLNIAIEFAGAFGMPSGPLTELEAVASATTEVSDFALACEIRHTATGGYQVLSQAVTGARRLGSRAWSKITGKEEVERREAPRQEAERRLAAEELIDKEEYAKQVAIQKPQRSRMHKVAAVVNRSVLEILRIWLVGYVLHRYTGVDLSNVKGFNLGNLIEKAAVPLIGGFWGSVVVLELYDLYKTAPEERTNRQMLKIVRSLFKFTAITLPPSSSRELRMVGLTVNLVGCALNLYLAMSKDPTATKAKRDAIPMD